MKIIFYPPSTPEIVKSNYLCLWNVGVARILANRVKQA